MRLFFTVFPLIVIGTLCWGSGWHDVEGLRDRTEPLYVEGLGPFEKSLNFDLSDISANSLYPESLRWGAQRNIGVDYSGGLFLNRLNLGLDDEIRTSANFTPRLMPFGGPLRYAHGRDFIFNLEEPNNTFADANFIEYYQYAMPFYKSTGEMEVSYGDFGSLTSSFKSTMPLDSLQLAVDVSWREFGNFRDGDNLLLTESLDKESPKAKYIDEADDEDIYQIRQVEANGKYTLSPTQELEFSGRFTDAEDVFFPELRMDAVYDRGSNVSASYHLKNPSATVQKLSFRAFSSHATQSLDDRWRVSKAQNSTDIPDLDTYAANAKSKSYSQGFDFRAIKVLSDSQIGFGMRRHWQEWEAKYGSFSGISHDMLPVINQTNFGAYLEGHRYLGNFMMTGALRIDQLDTEVDGDLGFIRQYRSDVRRGVSDSVVSASLRFEYDLNDFTQLFVEGAHASRAPDPNEMYVQYQYERAPGNSLLWFGNPNLESVKNTSFDLGIEVNLKRLKFYATTFYSRVRDMIYLENVGNSMDDRFLGTAMSYSNVDAILFGGESSIEIQISDSLKLSGTFELLQGHKTRLDGLSGDEDLAEMPPVRGAIVLDFNNSVWFGKVEVEMAKSQFEIDESISESPLDGYTVLNLMLGYYITDNVLFSVGVQNLSDQAYSIKNVNIRNPLTNYSVSNEPGRFVYMSLKWGF